MSEVLHPDYLNDFKELLDSNIMDNIIARLQTNEPGAILLLMEYPAADDPRVIELVATLMNTDDYTGSQVIAQLIHYNDIGNKPEYIKLIADYIHLHPQIAVVASLSAIANHETLSPAIQKIFENDSNLKEVAEVAANAPIPEIDLSYPAGHITEELSSIPVPPEPVVVKVIDRATTPSAPFDPFALPKM
jgi:hypothetical protein